MFHNDEVSLCRIPQWEDLGLKELWIWLSYEDDWEKYFPVKHERKMLDKQWICNIARAAYGEKFTKWLHQGKSNRYEKVTDKKVG